MLTCRLYSASQKGFTLLEVLIALSIFALMGVVSFRVLMSTIDAQAIGDERSQQLTQFQKTLSIIDRDLTQIVLRDVRNEIAISESVEVAQTDYAVEFTRGGWRNPLKLSRSSLQRVAYDLGLHPQSEDSESPFYNDETIYLRRHYWRELDRTEDTELVTQVLLPDVDDFTVAIIAEQGRFDRWPLTTANEKNESEEGEEEDVIIPIAIEFSFSSNEFGQVIRMHRIN
jgi:general secretion pathway protein J